MKSRELREQMLVIASPSVWRVWIEILIYRTPLLQIIVTLRVEGVD